MKKIKEIECEGTTERLDCEVYDIDQYKTAGGKENFGKYTLNRLDGIDIEKESLIERIDVRVGWDMPPRIGLNILFGDLQRCDVKDNILKCRKT